MHQPAPAFSGFEHQFWMLAFGSPMASTGLKQPITPLALATYCLPAGQLGAICTGAPAGGGDPGAAAEAETGGAVVAT